VGNRPVDRFLAPVITDYIREVQGKETNRGGHRLLLELEELDREWNSWKMSGSQETIVVVSDV